MKKEYIMPHFKNLKPIKIEESVINLRKSNCYKFQENILVEPEKDKFEEAFKKFREGNELLTKDYRILCYSIDTINKESYLMEFCKKILKNINNFVAYRGFVRPILSYIYNFYEDSNSTYKVYCLLMSVSKNLSEKSKFQYINEVVERNSTNTDFLKEIENRFRNIKLEFEIQDLSKKCMLKDTDKFYLKSMIDFTIKNHNVDELFECCKVSVNNMNLSMQQEVFKGILDFYINELDLEKYPDRWFKEISNILKDPYSGANTRWNELGEKYKETFRRWNNSKYLYDFFENKVGGDRQRLEFWKKYINSIYRMEYFKDLDDALVMEFKNHVFVELAKYGNALYIYKKDIYNIDTIKKYISIYSKTKCINHLKDRTIMDERLKHKRYWQSDFKYQLKRRGYEQDRW